MLQSIEIIQETPGDPESDLTIIYRGTDTSGVPFFEDQNAVAYDEVQATTAAFLSQKAVDWGIENDVE